MIILILFKKDCIWKLKIKIFRNFSPLSENPKPRSPLSFYPADQKILAYQRHLYIRRHVKYPGSANIPRNARNVFRVPEPSLSLSSNPFPPSRHSQRCRFPPVNNFARTVECTSPWTFYGTCFICVSVRFYRRPFLCFHTRARSSFRSKFPSDNGCKKRKSQCTQREWRRPPTRNFCLFYVSFHLSLSSSLLSFKHWINSLMN